MDRDRRWLRLFSTDVLARTPELVQAIKRDDSTRILAWFDRGLERAEQQLAEFNHRNRRMSALTQAIPAPLLEEILEVASWDDGDEMDDVLQKAQRGGFEITEDDADDLLVYQQSLRKHREAVEAWRRRRADARDVADVERKPVLRSEIDGHVVR